MERIGVDSACSVLDLKGSTLTTCTAIASAMAARTPTTAVSPSNGATLRSRRQSKEQQNPAGMHQTPDYRSVLQRFTWKFV
ncbi:hypothetical protein OESDEN_05425 [Oesophagostomum dentatum]|uniref:Uncharacterized protein n=1 Tax=Oesophagostomum dentatum TaxID=61180 RepID=A0A0B1TEZ7_OESDE|nr:hypothetical protein OESDEN_05425 [Oesophagostomum dentatum]